MKKVIALSGLLVVLATTACAQSPGTPPGGDGQGNPPPMSAELKAAFEACKAQGKPGDAAFETCMASKGFKKPEGKPPTK